MDTASPRRRKRRGWSLILLIGILTAGTVLFYPSLSQWAQADRSIDQSRISFGRVARGDLLRQVAVEGRIVASEQPTIASPAQGIISVLVRPGTVVQRGDVLAHIESPELQNVLEQEESLLESMQSDRQRQDLAARQADRQNQQQTALLEVTLGARQRAMERAKSLFDQGLGSSLDFETARDDTRVAAMELDNSREKRDLDRAAFDFDRRARQLETVRQNLVVEEVKRKIADLAVASPVAGLVSRVQVQDKDTVQPAQELFTVVDLSGFQVEIRVPENYAHEIATGTEAVIAYEGAEFAGSVQSLAPEVEASQVKGIVDFSGTPPSGLKQNQRVRTRLILDTRPDVLKVARGPFLEAMGGRQAYVVRDGLALLRSIRVGAVSVTEVEIISGLEDGEEIILSDLTRFQGVETILLRQ